MNKKYFFIIPILVLVIASFFIFGFTKPDESIQKAKILETQTPLNSFAVIEQKEQITKDQYNLIFEGYGPGKSHIGNFSKVQGNYIISKNNLDYIELKINASSVETGIEGLNKHLQSEDFFDTENNPQIIFISKEIKKDSITGYLTIKGITKEVLFAIEKENNKITSDFLIDVREFGINYIGINDEVRIEFYFDY